MNYPEINDGKKSPEENIFDLTKLAHIEVQQQLEQSSKQISLDEKNKLLRNYEELSNEQWDNLKYGDYIRYLRTDGSFRRGGIFKNAFVGNYGTREGQKCIQLSSSYHDHSHKWTVYLNDIDKIWIRKKNRIQLENNSGNIEISSEIQNTITSQSERIEYLTKIVDQLKIDMLKMNNEQKRIINLIKKLHGIKSSANR